MLILHDLLAHIVQVHWWRYRQAKEQYEKVKNDKTFPPMRVKSKIATPLKFTSEFIKIKYGQNSTITFLWKSLNNNYLDYPLSFTLEDFELKKYYTGTK